MNDLIFFCHSVIFKQQYLLLQEPTEHNKCYEDIVATQSLENEIFLVILLHKY